MQNLNFQILNRRNALRHSQAGMTYIELIVVLSIFAVMTSVTLFNYTKFQGKVDIKNLSNDIAVKVVAAQKDALSGALPSNKTIPSPTWKPAYGVYFTAVMNANADNKNFIYFTDLDNSGGFDDVACPSTLTNECLDKVTITKGNYISKLEVFYPGDATAYNLNDLSITFKRPNSDAVIKSNGLPIVGAYYVQVTIMSPSASAFTNKIKVYTSGRIQIN